jgi:hypothetical protein
MGFKFFLLQKLVYLIVQYIYNYVHVNFLMYNFLGINFIIINFVTKHDIFFTLMHCTSIMKKWSITIMYCTLETHLKIRTHFITQKEFKRKIDSISIYIYIPSVFCAFYLLANMEELVSINVDQLESCLLMRKGGREINF